MCDQHNHRPDRRRILAAIPAAALVAGLGLRPARANAPNVDLPPPGPRDTCPVCGMFVAKYPEWVATVLWEDGQAAHFDGAKDFFKYLADLEKYAPGRTDAEIVGMGVTEYYGLALVDARAATYVIGSDVFGPMGHELVPLSSPEDAEDFFKDHFAKGMVKFDDVNSEMLKGLDEGVFE